MIQYIKCPSEGFQHRTAEQKTFHNVYYKAGIKYQKMCRKYYEVNDSGSTFLFSAVYKNGTMSF